MTSSEIRQSFLDFFKSKGHTIVPSSSLLPDAPNLLFTNAGMNQFVPIFLGQQKAPFNPPRAADTQKCIRAGGKHNDLEDVGLDTYHHTFFEMLGNWSFGDYFKKEAIEWAWELVTGVWKFPKDRLYATVYKPGQGDPSDFDQEAYEHWAKLFTAAGLDPKVHIVNGGKKDNFWMMGETGPCGPCSEIHVDLTPEGNTRGSLVNKGDARCIEIWNLVFIQFNANQDGTFSPLPARHVDTGMGFERVTSIIQGTKNFTDFKNAKISNYETDVFRPIFDALEKLSGKKYGSTLPIDSGSTGNLPVPLGDPPSGMGTTPLSTTRAVTQMDAVPSSAGPVAQRDRQVACATQEGASYSRRNLPHFEKPWAIYHVIIKTIPARKLSPAARDIVFDCIVRWNEKRYRLVAACVMPDHAHFIIQPGVKEEGKDGKPVFWPLSEILHSIKSYSAKEVNKLDRVSGTLWQEERYDRYMRGDADLQEKFQYVCANPWASGLAKESEPWRWLWPSEGGRTRGGEGDVTRTDVPPPSAGPVARRDRQVACATPEEVQTDIAFRVIADHIRTLSFAIADGIQPSNTDRGYVLRRILRRAVRYGRTLGFHEPFFYKLVDVVAETMGGIFPEIRSRKEHVRNTIRIEEEAFNKTLDKGIEIFNEHVAKALPRPEASAGQRVFEGVIPGWVAFMLYDTYGFPLDLTQVMARERGLSVDHEEFEKYMQEQRERGRKAQKKQVVELSQIEAITPTKFVGYEQLSVTAKVLDVVAVKEKTAVVLDTSAAYAESGGQVGDTGRLSQGGRLWRVVNTQKVGNAWVHFVEQGIEQTASVSRPATGRTEEEGASKSQRAHKQGGGDPIPPGGSPGGTGESPVLPEVGADVEMTVDRPRREAIQRHHTVTHLLHWALHEVVSREAAQKGSYVGPEKLTFDFNSAALMPAQLRDVEKLVNERIVEGALVSWDNVPYASIKGRKDIMQFFGEKYGDEVRVVQIGGEAKALNGYSMELCGGTHTKNTGEIGLFRIVAEGAIASGVRRIEAVAGLRAYEKMREEMELLSSLAGKVNSPVGELEKKVESLLAHQKELEKELKALQQKQAAESARGLIAKAQTFGQVRAIIENLGTADGDYLQGVADALKGEFKGVIVLGGVAGGAVSLVAAVSPEFTAKAQAGKIIQAIAPIVGGKGGGRPDNARGGGRDASKLNEALTKASEILKNL